MESESADEGICTGTQVAQDTSNTNAANNQNAIPSLNDIPPSLEQETLMGVRFLLHFFTFARFCIISKFFLYPVLIWFFMSGKYSIFRRNMSKC